MALADWVVVEQGESVDSVAARHGHVWQTLWNAPENAKLKGLRKNPHVLAPGDRLYVPALRPKEAPVRSSVRQRFRRKGFPAVLELILRGADGPLADHPYSIAIGGRVRAGRTGPDGSLRHHVDPETDAVYLRVGDDPDGPVLELTPHAVDPLGTTSGVQARLRALGLFAGDADGVPSEELRAAIARFQSGQGGRCPIDGQLDAKTLKALEAAYAPARSTAG